MSGRAFRCGSVGRCGAAPKNFGEIFQAGELPPAETFQTHLTPPTFVMYHHIKKLMFTVRAGQPDPRFGNMLLEQFDGELAAAM